jgi:hypothetical protein
MLAHEPPPELDDELLLDEEVLDDELDELLLELEELELELLEELDELLELEELELELDDDELPFTLHAPPVPTGTEPPEPLLEPPSMPRINCNLPCTQAEQLPALNARNR